ncbi:MAG: hypothetical protein IKZ85_05725, partial [Pseudobutyrivibrio sp.]|nr:hypothetical protein [Pseudobutyrivibrio sp.]
MKNKKIFVLLACSMMGLYLCSCGKNITEEKDEAIDNANEISVEEEAVDKEEDSAEEEDSVDYIDDVAKADLNANDYTHVVSKTNEINSDFTLVSFVVDLDNDGTDEAFVLEVYWNETNNSPLTEDSTFEATRIWFVDEKGDGIELHDFAENGPVSVHETLDLVTVGDNSYLFVSSFGELAAYSQTIIYTVKNNAIHNASDLPCYGSKIFVDGEFICY